MLEIDILRNYSQKNRVSLGVISWGFAIHTTPRCPNGKDLGLRTVSFLEGSFPKTRGCLLENTSRTFLRTSWDYLVP